MFNIFDGDKSKQEMDDIKDELIDIKYAIGKIAENIDNQNNINWKFVLSVLPLYFPALTFIAVLMGSLKSKSYLENIGYGSIFSEVIGSPVSLIAIVVSYSLMIFLLSFYFLLPYFNFIISNHSNKIFNNMVFDEKLVKINLSIFSLVPIFLFLWASSVYFDFYFQEYILYFVFIHCFLAPIIIACKHKKFSDRVFYYFILSFLLFFACIFPILYIKAIILFESDGFWQFIIFSATILVPVIPNIFYCIILKNQKDGAKKDDSTFMAVLSVLLLVIFCYILTATTRFSDLSLHIPKFIEKPKNSSWYLIHNSNTTSETVNGMTKDEIKSRRQSFIPNGWQHYCKDDIFNNVNMRNCPTLRNENALHGYMAWNLGNTKVFCPQSVDFFQADTKEQRYKMSEKCLVIDGKYLQPISAKYVSAW